jgi:[acyl-carrier-protein] S-malonyltransferase
MQEAVPEGTGLMAAVLGLSRETVIAVCREAAGRGVVSPANYNSPGQIVIAGEKTAVEAAMRLAKEKGAKKVIPLPVSVPSHCALMEPARRRLQESLERTEIGDLRIPLVTNVEAKPVTGGNEIRKALIKQLAHPVLWEDSVLAMVASGIEIFIEVGAGRVLSGLIKRIHREAQVWNVEDSQSLTETIQALNLTGEAV